jgi:hypothetical protein
MDEHPPLDGIGQGPLNFGSVKTKNYDFDATLGAIDSFNDLRWTIPRLKHQLHV